MVCVTAQDRHGSGRGGYGLLIRRLGFAEVIPPIQGHPQHAQSICIVRVNPEFRTERGFRARIVAALKSRGGIAQSGVIGGFPKGQEDGNCGRREDGADAGHSVTADCIVRTGR